MNNDIDDNNWIDIQFSKIIIEGKILDIVKNEDNNSYYLYATDFNNEKLLHQYEIISSKDIDEDILNEITK